MAGATTGIEDLAEAISEQVNEVTSSDPFAEWISDQPCRAGDLVVLNNSFLYREGLKTRKNVRYLSIPVTDDGSFGAPEIVSLAASVNVRFKRVAAQSAGQLSRQPLAVAVTDEVQHSGVALFSLVGAIGTPESTYVPMDGKSPIRRLRFQPASNESDGGAATITDDELVLAQLGSIDEAWNSCREALARAGHDAKAIDAVADAFESSFNDLQEAAARPIRLDSLDSNDSVISRLVERLDGQVEQYERALQGGDAGSSTGDDTELLRVAYNFADGTKTLMKLIVGVSDLKPIVFWLSLSEQFDLAQRFSELPFGLVGTRKPSLERYRQLISAARNRSFHDVFAFDRPFIADLPPEAFAASRLRLFRDYSQRTAPALDYEDRELVELLSEFTRTPDRSVPEGFWEQNLEVMRGVIQTVSAFGQALRAVVSARDRVSGSPDVQPA